MEIVRTAHGFIERLNHPAIQSLEFDFAGTCRIQYRDQTAKTIDFSSSVYHTQYGIPVSADGTTLFRGNWEDGVHAIRAEDGSVLWHHRQSRITRIIAYLDYVIALRVGAAVLKLDLHTGEILNEIRSSTIEQCFPLKSPYALIDRIKGKLTVLDTDHMKAVRSYSASEYNPNNCLSCMIRDAQREAGKLVLSGFEEYPNRDYTQAGTREFIRTLPI